MYISASLVETKEGRGEEEWGGGLRGEWKEESSEGEEGLEAGRRRGRERR